MVYVDPVSTKNSVLTPITVSSTYQHDELIVSTTPSSGPTKFSAENVGPVPAFPSLAFYFGLNPHWIFHWWLDSLDYI